MIPKIVAVLQVKKAQKTKKEINHENLLLCSVAHWKILPEIIQN